MAPCGARGEAIFAPPTLPRLPPLGCKSQKFGLEGWGDPNKAKTAGNKKIEVMWYMGLKRVLYKVCAWCFAFFGPLGVFLVTLARYYPLDMYHTPLTCTSCYKAVTNQPSAAARTHVLLQEFLWGVDLCIFQHERNRSFSLLVSFRSYSFLYWIISY